MAQIYTLDSFLTQNTQCVCVIPQHQDFSNFPNRSLFTQLYILSPHFTRRNQKYSALINFLCSTRGCFHNGFLTYFQTSNLKQLLTQKKTDTDERKQE